MRLYRLVLALAVLVAVTAALTVLLLRSDPLQAGSSAATSAAPEQKHAPGAPRRVLATAPAGPKAAARGKAAEPAAGEPKAAPPADPLVDIGSFISGSERAIEKSSFTGCPFVYVMIRPEDPDFAQVAAVLADAQVSAAMRGFTGCLLDRRVASEYAIEQGFEEKGLQIIVRSMSGGFLGGLEYGFEKQNLLDLLQRIVANHPRAIHRSPLFSRLVNLPESIARVKEVDGLARATALVDLVEEQLGSADSRVAELRSQLGQ